MRRTLTRLDPRTVTIVLLLVAVLGLVLVIRTQVQLDDEPYPCTPVPTGVAT